MAQFNMFVGVDVSKARLDVHCLPGGETFAVDNTGKGRKALVARLLRMARAGGPLAVAFEASGGYERRLGKALVLAGLTAFLLHAGQTRSFALARRQHAKTDKLDALVIARALGALHDGLKPYVFDPRRERIVEHLRLRDRQIVTITMLKSQLEILEDAALRRIVTREIDQIERIVAMIEKAMRDIILADAELAGLYRRLLAAPGVGPILAATLIGRLGELGTLSSRAVAAMAGLAPYDRQSGTKDGPRRCGGGRADLRRALYMGALAIARMKKHNPLTQTYKRLTEMGKPFKVAIVAVMRKLLVAINAMVAKNQKWSPA